jgi:hypothetical protein
MNILGVQVIRVIGPCKLPESGTHMAASWLAMSVEELGPVLSDWAKGGLCSGLPLQQESTGKLPSVPAGTVGCHG